MRFTQVIVLLGALLASDPASADRTSSGEGLWQDPILLTQRPPIVPGETMLAYLEMRKFLGKMQQSVEQQRIFTKRIDVALRRSRELQSRSLAAPKARMLQETWEAQDARRALCLANSEQAVQRAVQRVEQEMQRLEQEALRPPMK